MSGTEVAPGVFRLVLPLGIHGIPNVNAYLLADSGGDTWLTAASPSPMRAARRRTTAHPN